MGKFVTGFVRTLQTVQAMELYLRLFEEAF